MFDLSTIHAEEQGSWKLIDLVSKMPPRINPIVSVIGGKGEILIMGGHSQRGNNLPDGYLFKWLAAANEESDRTSYELEKCYQSNLAIRGIDN